MKSLDSHATEEDTKMPDPPPYPGTGDDTAAAHDTGPAARRSRRGIVYWIIGVVLILLFLVLHLTGTLGPGSHG